MKQIAYDTEHFSSRRVVVRNARPEITMPSPPITSDPPNHKPAKQLPLPPFTLDAMKKIEPRVRQICNELIDDFITDKTCDAAAQYSKHIPARTIAHMLGIPESDGHLFVKWIHESLELGVHNDAILMNAAKEMNEYFLGHITERRTTPCDDLITDLIRAKVRTASPVGPACCWIVTAAADRRHRHYVERHRLVALASGQDRRTASASSQNRN